MTYQAASWTDPRGERVPEAGYLVGQIFFPTDVDSLDRQDLRQLSRLIGPFRILLRNRSVQFSMVGNADHRHNASYNRDLAFRRANSVMYYFNNAFLREQNYSAGWVVTLGEEYASRGPGIGRRELALDRRVDIFASRTPSFEMELPPTDIGGKPPLELRITDRNFSKVAGSNAGRTPDAEEEEEAFEAIGELIAQYVGGNFDANRSLFIGDERPHRRLSKMTPRHHRVNRVEITTRYRYEVIRGGDFTHEETSVHYEWGRANSIVRISLDRTTDLPGYFRRRHREWSVLRQVAEHIRDLLPPLNVSA